MSHRYSKSIIFVALDNLKVILKRNQYVLIALRELAAASHPSSALTSINDLWIASDIRTTLFSPRYQKNQLYVRRKHHAFPFRSNTSFKSKSASILNLGMATCIDAPFVSIFVSSNEFALILPSSSDSPCCIRENDHHAHLATL